MALSVATNVGALAAAKSASSVNRSMETSMARLASGNRINTARDDAAGLAISARLTSEARGLDMAARNAADAQSLIDTIESAHNEIANILQRMRELSVQGASDTNSTEDRTYIVAEIDELVKEIDDISSDTKWAENTLIDDANAFIFQLGNEKDENITLTTSKVTSTDLSVSDTSSLTDAAGFTSHIDTVNSAIASIAEYRADYGAVSNRLNHTMSHLATSSEAVKASLGRIQDTDFAAESTNLAKTQILQQAATSMLAQANASKQTVLSLLQG